VTEISHKNPRVNDRIAAREVRTIGSDGSQLGILPIEEALKAAAEAGLDLVEVAPDGVPPVCKVMDYGKYLYEQKRKEHGAKRPQRSHASEIKEIRLRPSTLEHDLQIKAKKCAELVEKGYRVQLTMVYKGREMSHRELGTNALQHFLEMMGDKVKIEKGLTTEGRRASIVIAPVK